MPSMEERLASLDFHKEEMVQALGELIRVPAIGPENGGDGEFARSRMIKEMLEHCGFDEVEVLEILDDRVKLKSRPNIVARKKGKNEKMVWFVTHMDTVPPGDLQAWSYPPFSPRLIDGKIYGLGTEDNGQALIASIFAMKLINDAASNPELGLGLVVVVVRKLRVPAATAEPDAAPAAANHDESERIDEALRNLD